MFRIELAALPSDKLISRQSVDPGPAFAGLHLVTDVCFKHRLGSNLRVTQHIDRFKAIHDHIL
jgi:hypothetical protein